MSIESYSDFDIYINDDQVLSLYDSDSGDALHSYHNMLTWNSLAPIKFFTITGYIDCEIRVSEESKNNFWEIAREIKDMINTQLEEKKPLQYNRFLNKIDVKKFADLASKNNSVLRYEVGLRLGLVLKKFIFLFELF